VALVVAGRRRRWSVTLAEEGKVLPHSQIGRHDGWPKSSEKQNASEPRKQRGRSVCPPCCLRLVASRVLRLPRRRRRSRWPLPALARDCPRRSVGHLSFRRATSAPCAASGWWAGRVERAANAEYIDVLVLPFRRSFLVYFLACDKTADTRSFHLAARLAL